MKKSFDPNKCISLLNNVKQAMQATGQPFTKKSMLEGLKGCGLPTSSNFWTVFRNSGLIQEVSKGKFLFTNKNPIYIGALVAIKKKYSELIKRYNHTKEKETQKEEEIVEGQVFDSKAMTQFAIDFLKEQGYQIFEPTSIVYRKL